jgi:nicotinate-nucleotide--dimethylbenzimidazole phosphoribosyltransferase
VIDLAELGFDAISAPDSSFHEASCRRLDSLTKPLGALGRLEALAAQVCAMQRTLEPAIIDPVAIVFAADHGVADRGVSAYPRAVTREMVKNFLAGGAAINVLARFDEMELWVVDAGVDGECAAHPRLIGVKIRAGTRDFTAEPAMTRAECRAALAAGRRIAAELSGPRGNALVLGEMGIGNTASSALLMHALTGQELALCVGRGTGLDDAGVARKQAVLAEAAARIAPPEDPFELLCEFGGYEIAMLTGAMLGAASRRQLILVDGFTVTAAAALAARADANMLGYCVFGHCSAENAHRELLQHLGVRPLLDLGMRLGEGSGAALALPLVRAALALFGQMATFEGAGVSQKIA